MSNRRVPLADVPNVLNSPFRTATGAASKRPRAQSVVAGEIPYGQPPAKKQIVEVEESAPRTPSRRQGNLAEGRVFNKRPTDSQPTAFDRKLLAVKDKPIHARPTKHEKTLDETLETVRQWQKHYRKVFPSFVFYFESVTEDVRKQCSRQIAGLGAREEKFFSRNVTHIVTTRSIPTESDGNTSVDAHSASATTQENTQPRTINPSLLEKSSDYPHNHHGTLPKSKFLLDGLAAKRSELATLRKQPSGSNDILRKAKDMGIKIWQLEKFERIIHVIFEDRETGFQSQHGHNTRSNVAIATLAANPGRQVDLSNLIRNEQLNGPSDRESTLATGEYCQFKGPHIIIRDMNEKCKPIMIREYAKVQTREDGAWPQFRSVSLGKCPFIEESTHSRRDIEREEAREQRRLAQAKVDIPKAPRTRASAAIESIKMQPPAHATRKQPLTNVEHGANLIAQPTRILPAATAKQSVIGKVPSPVKGSRHFPPGIGPGFYGGEPQASGLQRSNITSAIRSQMISSTAAAPGAKAGMSKEVHELKRKVLERNTGPSLNGMGASRGAAGTANTVRQLRDFPPARLAKQKAQEKLGQKKLGNIKEEHTPSEEAEAKRKSEFAMINALKSLKGEKREPKPGYCENCREKFEDFEEHTLGRKHRKFAVDRENWKELDGLLKELVRPLREDRNDE
ncbi:MAG: hypothetical protein Q9187_007614 [Circinaria calcarea]